MTPSPQNAKLIQLISRIKIPSGCHLPNDRIGILLGSRASRAQNEYDWPVFCIDEMRSVIRPSVLIGNDDKLKLIAIASLEISIVRSGGAVRSKVRPRLSENKCQNKFVMDDWGIEEISIFLERNRRTSISCCNSCLKFISSIFDVYS